jgi:DNA repair protein RecN (Recombination protein N)
MPARSPHELTVSLDTEHVISNYAQTEQVCSMLLSLSIRNLAVIESAELDFSTGLHVISGETGAGKSVLLRALRLALGHRGSREWVRTGTTSAEVKLRFQLNGVEHSVERRLSAKGGGQARHDGELVTVSQLRELGTQVARVCGQHNASALLEPDRHRSLVDRFAGVLLTDMSAAWEAWRTAQDEVDALTRAADSATEQAEFIRYQVQELDSFGPEDDEEEALELERAQLQHASRLRKSLRLVEQHLDAGDGAATQRLSKAEDLLHDLADVDPQNRQLAERLADLRYAIEAVASEARGASHAQQDPQRLEEVTERLSDLRRLARKHRCPARDLLRVLERLRAQLNTLENLGDRMVQAEQRATQARARAVDIAQALTAVRTQKARLLDRQVTTTLRDLAMPDACFSTQVGTGALGPHGSDQVVFMLSANLGEAQRPLHKVASGGELSRVVLAIELALSTRGEGSPSYVFDEVDSGMGGQTADAVGQKLATLAAKGQVLCISHLPQIARLADHHYAVGKYVAGGRTLSTVTALPEQQRNIELARMLGGAFAEEWIARVA